MTADTAAAEEQAESAADEAAPETEPSSADGAGAGNAEENDSETPAGASSADPAELAAVQQVVDKYAKALTEKDYETLVDITDIDLLYLISEGETADRAQYLTYMKDNVFMEEADYSGYEFSAPYLEDGYVEEYENFFKMMEEESEGALSITDKFKIDRVYAVRMKQAGIDMDMPIIHVNGEWKCDPNLSMVMAFYGMAESMADSFSSEATEG